MTRDEINAYCRDLPSAYWDDPFGGGHDVWKIGDKMFAMMGTANRGVSIKCADPETAAMLIDLGRAKKAPYLNRGGWILVEFGAMETAEFQDRLLTSYLKVRRSLTKKAQAALEPEPATSV